jgi:hypothetical protein
MSGDITEFRRHALCPAKRIERLEALVRELEVLTHDAKDLPLPLVLQGLNTLAKARAVLHELVESAAASEPADADGEPQPEIDGDALERMYLALGAGRLPPKR